ncbi:MAG TPA: tetratricopeptide repeat protein, partial [Candidatus Hodarchaeales archaeon]|nr:tetratricopeptide repeat protein [Candidatus Hodarchaeales archaeon]
MGRKFHRLGLYKEAIEQYFETIKHYPDEPFAWYYLGEAYYNMGKYDDAHLSYSRVVSLFSSDDRLESRDLATRIATRRFGDFNEDIFTMAQFGLTLVYSSTGKTTDTQEQLEWFKMAEDLSDDPFTSGLASFLRASLSRDQGDYVTAKHEAEMAVNKLSYLSYWAGRSLWLLGRIQWNYDNSPDSLVYLERSKEHFEQIEEFDFIALALRDIAVIHIESGDFKQGHKTLVAAHDFAEKTGNLRNAARSKTSIGELHIKIGDYSQAEERLQEAKHLWEQIGETGNLANVYTNLARLAKIRGDERKATKLVNVFLNDLVNKEGDVFLKVKSLIRSVEILLGIEKTSRIEQLLEFTKKLLNKHKLATLEPELLLVSARVSIFKENRGEAEKLLAEAAEKAEKTNQKAVLQQVLLAQIENLLENYLLTYDEKYVTEANNLIVKTVALSSDLPTDPDYLHILFIEAHFALVDGDIVKATSLLNSAESIAKEKGFNKELARIEKIRRYSQQIEKRTERREIESVLSAISSFKYDSELIDLSKVQGVIYIMTEKGMEPLVTTVPVTSENEPFHIQLGTMLSFIVGQGHDYNEGTFGPLPGLGGLFGQDKFMLAIARSVKNETS